MHKIARGYLFTLFGWYWVLAGVLNVACVSMCAKEALAVDGALIYALLAICLGVGVFTFVAAISFLRRRPWARSGLEVVCWLGIACAPMTLWYLHTVRHSLLAHHLPETDRLAGSLRPLGWGTWAALIAYGLSNWFIRSKVVRAAFTVQHHPLHEA